MVCVGLQCSGMTSRGKFWRGHWGGQAKFGGGSGPSWHPPSSAPAPRSGNKTIHYKILHKRIFAGEGSTELKLLMSHLQQLFTLHWYRRLRHDNDYSTYQHQCQMDFSMEWPKKNSRGPTVVKFDFINSKLRERHLSKNLMNIYEITTSTRQSSLPLLKLMHTSTL